MVPFDSYIFGDRALQHQFCVTAEVLGHVISSAPESINIRTLVKLTGLPVAELVKVCGNLIKGGLLERKGNSSDGWKLVVDPWEVTLEDVFLSIVAAKKSSALHASGLRDPQSGREGVSLIVMQAAFAVNQSVLKQLRQFPLDRLKVKKDEIPPYFDSYTSPRNVFL